MVSQGAILVKIENEAMTAAAMVRPRVPGKIKQEALEELNALPAEAGLMFYSIPYKERQQDGSDKTVQVEGPSVVMATSLAQRWGNCSVGSRVLDESVDGATVEGVFLDLEKNFRITRQVKVSRFKKRRTGHTVTLDSERWAVEQQIGASKAMRNAILSGIPRAIWVPLVTQAKAIVANKGKPPKSAAAAEKILEKKADKAQVEKAIAAFAQWSVGVADLEKALECKSPEWTGGHIAKLQGMWQAIKDGQSTVKEMFGGPEPEGQGEAKTAAGPAPFSPADVAAGKIETQERLL
jgi:hypothetical protein